MWEIITGHWALEPPACGLVEFTRPDGTVFDGWTYGGALLDVFYQSQDIDLRRTIAQCMGECRRPGENSPIGTLTTAPSETVLLTAWIVAAHVPANRPTMFELEKIILDKLQSDWSTLELEVNTKTAVRDTLEEPTA